MGARMRVGSLLLVVVAAFGSTGCKWMIPAPTPMTFVHYPVASPAAPHVDVLLLPGRGDAAEVFEEHGFIAALRKRSIAAEVTVANASIGYYVREKFYERMDTDVLPHLPKSGLWVGGISLGGLGSVLIAERHPERFAGLVLIAPYLGDDDIIDEIEKAGGLAKWKAPVGETDHQRRVWRYLQHITLKTEGAPKLYLGFGSEDGLNRAHRLLVAVLPKERVFPMPGGHVWEPWTKVWEAVLDTRPFEAATHDDEVRAVPAETEDEED